MSDADGRARYPDCRFCNGHGFFNCVSRDGVQSYEAQCGNCAERRRWEGLHREPQRTWCVWTKTGRRPSFWHNSQNGAENEAARLARKHPGKTFIVFEKVVNISAERPKGE